MVMIDLVVDPLSVLGDRWFLGKIFWYDPPGPHFGVPISNYLGWYFVAAVTIPIFQFLDARLNRGAVKPAGLLLHLPSRALMGPALYGGIALFGITMLFVIHAYEIAWASVFIYLPFTVLIVHIVTRRDSYGDAAAIQRHLIDFPYERSLNWHDAPRRDDPLGWRKRDDAEHLRQEGVLRGVQPATSVHRRAGWSF